MLTIEDIRNPQRKSGFNGVARNSSGGARGHGGGKPYYANHGTKAHYKGEKTNSWYGPRRSTATEAAQDYCDYINGGAAAPMPRVRSAGHGGKRVSNLKDHPKYQQGQALMREAREEVGATEPKKQQHIYCIAEAEGLHPLVKVGISDNPEARIGECQTGNGRRLFLLTYFAGTEADEKALHAEFIKDNTLGEWFRPSDELLSKFGYDLYDLYEKGSAAAR